MRAISGAAILIGALLAGAPPKADAQIVQVDVELCLAADGSGSITDDEFQFQRSGYAAALIDQRVLDAIRLGARGGIALALMEWGGAQSMNEIVGWSLVSDRASAEQFAARLIAAPRLAFGWNSISNAIAFCQEWLEANAFDGTLRVIDVSGDAGQRGGIPLPIARQRALDAGITINALALNFRGGGLTGPGGLPLIDHFETEVIGGPGAFAIVVAEEHRFVESLVQKLVQEIAGKQLDPEEDVHAGEADSHLSRAARGSGAARALPGARAAAPG
ncbi:MAG TPA: DUF1194 domain-containing protein [Alphaproteobacteria bacterium]|nr:DUF1194 domain-containing protein [Alphaproteobacteria bacterium]